MLLQQPPARGLRRAIGQMLVGACVCLVGYATWAVESDIAASGESARVNISNSVIRISSDNTTILATPAGVAVEPGVAVEQSSAAALPPAPEKAAAPKLAAAPPARLRPGQVWECVIGGQRVFSDVPCGADASIRRVRDLDSRDAAPAANYAHSDRNGLPYAPAPPLAPAPADEPDFDSGSLGLLEAPERARHPRLPPPVPKS